MWGSPSDPLLWRSLLDHAVAVSGSETLFQWRGLVLKQPVREGAEQVVMSEDGDTLIFRGRNPNEVDDFPSAAEQKERLREAKLAKVKVQHRAVDLDWGNYAGGVLDGKYMGEGVFSWNNGQVFSGQWVGGLREGTGTEIFPPHDNTKVDEEGELTFPYYEGNLLEGKRSGKGLYTFANGDKYQGEFLQNLFHGEGKFIWKSGEILSCQWRNGLPQSDRVMNIKFKGDRKLKKTKSKAAKKKAAGDKSDAYGFAADDGGGAGDDDSD